MEVRVDAREAREATVKPNGNGAHVGVPKEWDGEDVLVIRLPQKVSP